jgi:hypothetical protein
MFQASQSPDGTCIFHVWGCPLLSRWAKLAYTQVQVAKELVHHSSHDYACLSCFYRGLYKYKADDGGIFDHDIKQQLEIILGNKLILPTDRKHYCDCLFLEIGDNELPRDRAQTDWLSLRANTKL